MISALPISYIVLKMGAPAYSVFIVIFAINFIQMGWGWTVIHRYVSFSYKELIVKVYVPTIAITVVSVIAPILIIHFMEQGWMRLIILGFATEVVLLSSIYLIVLGKKEKTILHNIIKTKILRR